MKLEYQKAIVAIPLSEYAQSYKDAGDPHLHVWVNIPRALHQERNDLDLEYQKLQFEETLASSKFREKLNELSQQTERKKEAIEKERKRLVSAREKEQAESQAKFEDYTTRNYEWFSQVWSQGPADTHWPLEDLRELEKTDLMLLGWMADQTRELLRTRRVDQKKS